MTDTDIRGALELVTAPQGLAITLAAALRQCRDPVGADDEVTELIREAAAYCEQEIYGNRQLLPAVYDLPLRHWWCGQPCRGWCNAFLQGGGGFGGAIGTGLRTPPVAHSLRPCSPLQLPRPPLRGVSSVTYYDQAGALQTLDTTFYEVRAPLNQPGRVAWLPLAVAPALQAGREYPITVRFTAGYESADKIPVLAQRAMKLLVGHWFDNREATGEPWDAADRVLALLEWGSYK